MFRNFVLLLLFVALQSEALQFSGRSSLRRGVESNQIEEVDSNDPENMLDDADNDITDDAGNDPEEMLDDADYDITDDADNDATEIPPHILRISEGAPGAPDFNGKPQDIPRPEVMRNPQDAPRPHILHIILDDWGWGDATWHRPQEIVDADPLEAPETPHLNALHRAGVELDRHYVFRVCSPTRSAIQSGRNPLQVNVQNFVSDQAWNPKDNVSGYAGIPVAMTGIAQHMSRGGYETHFYGKWDAGMATWRHTPAGRGYMHSLTYWGHGNDMWSFKNGIICGEGEGVTLKELWDHNRPAHHLQNAEFCSQDHQNPRANCTYEEVLFKDRVLQAIRRRTDDKPLFITWAPHLVHVPYEVPWRYLWRWKHIVGDWQKQYLFAMIEYADEEIGQVIDELYKEGIWNDTLVVLHSDNGAPTEFGGNNWPLKGGKNSNWEGGIRVNAIVSGGFIPEKMRGKKNEGLITGWDWYATFANLAGQDPMDKDAEAAGLHPIDSHNMWPMISGEVKESPRTHIMIGDTDDKGDAEDGSSAQVWIGGMIQGRYKLLVGILHQKSWTTMYGANVTDRESGIKKRKKAHCGWEPETGCLYDIYADPQERVNLAQNHTDIYHSMMAHMTKSHDFVFNPYRGSSQPKLACDIALKTYGGFWGPFVQDGAYENTPPALPPHELTSISLYAQ